MQFGDLPPELHSHIASYLCQTGAPALSSLTGAIEHEDTFTRSSILSLEQVSKYWSSIAQLYKYRVLKVLVTPAKEEGTASPVLRLFHRLVSLPAHKRRTHYLHLSGSSTSAPDSAGVDYNQTLPQLISLLSPTLRSLTLSFPASRYSTSLFAYTYSVYFPLLNYLCIDGFYPPPRIPAADSSEPRHNAQTNFPALERLRISGVRNPSGLLPSCPLHLIFPVLRTLEIEGVSGAPSFANDVALAVAAHDDFISSHSIPDDLSADREALSYLSPTHPRRTTLPVTLTYLTISLLSLSNPMHQGPNTPHSHFLGQRHAKMIGILKSLEDRPRCRDRLQERVEVTIVEHVVRPLLF